MKQKGFTLLELLCALAVAAIAMAIVMPAFRSIMQRSRRDAAVRQVVLDVREARAQAITTGWEYRIVGYGADEDSSLRNQYRILARRSTAVAWPDESASPFESATQKAEGWKNIATEYPGVNLEAGDERFELTFDARGTSAAGAFNPLTVTGHDGSSKSLTVSLVGAVTVQ
jgi:type IV fimbrial biogenesis protein FimT